MSRKLIHGYYAAASFTDAQIGRLLDGLITLNLQQNTIIVLWGDHGWYLGDFGDWCKHSNYEVATRVPLIISVPQPLGGYRGETLCARRAGRFVSYTLRADWNPHPSPLPRR